MIRGFQFNVETVFAVIAVFTIPLAGIAYLLAPVECPVCHDGNVDENGRCRYGDSCKHYVINLGSPLIPPGPAPGYTGIPGHRLHASCYLCGGRSRTFSRLGAIIAD